MRPSGGPFEDVRHTVRLGVTGPEAVVAVAVVRAEEVGSGLFIRS